MDRYDLERYFGTGHWISRDGKIEVPLKSAEHAEIAPDVVEKYYEDDFLDMDPGLSLSDYSDFLLNKGWIVHREGNFLCNRLDNTTKDTIFLFAKKNKLSKITVETPQKVKLIEEPPENIYEAKIAEQKKPHSFYRKQKFQRKLQQVFEDALKEADLTLKDVSFGPRIEIDDLRPRVLPGTKAQAYFYDPSIHMIHIPEIVDLRTLKVALHEIGHVIVRKQKRTFDHNEFKYENEKFAERFAVEFMKKYGITPPGKYEPGIWQGDTRYAKSWKKIREQKNYQRYFAWIDPDGKVHKCDFGQIHDSWAHDYILKNHRLMWNILKGDNVDDSRVFTEYLLERGWVRQSDCSFETNSMRKSVCWNIYEAAKSAGCNSVFVDHHSVSVVEATLEKFIEENG